MGEQVLTGIAENVMGMNRVWCFEEDYADDATPRLWREFLSASGPRRAELLRALVEVYLPIVAKTAENLRPELPPPVQYGDLIGPGFFGLVDAIEAFDPGRGCRFATFAPVRVQGAMRDAIRDLIQARRPRAMVGLTGRDKERVDLRCGDPADRSAGEDWWRHVCAELGRVDRLIVVLRYRERLRMREIAGALGVRESQVSVRHAKVIGRLRTRLAAEIPLAVA